MKRILIPSKLNKQSGFSLLELMITITIVGILYAIAIPRLQAFRYRAIQVEAKQGLHGVFLSMLAYQSAVGEFPTLNSVRATQANIGFNMGGNMPRYMYKITSNSSQYSVVASSVVAGTWAVTPLYNGKIDTHRTNSNHLMCTPFDAVSNRYAPLDICTSAYGSGTQSVVTGCPQSATGIVELIPAIMLSCD